MTDINASVKKYLRLACLQHLSADISIVSKVSRVHKKNLLYYQK